jgi:potassium/chloride transporter 4/5/6
MAGANRSGDLKDASKSIPKGTLMATLSTTFMYICFIFLFAVTANTHTLKDLSKIFFAEVSWPFKWLVVSGVILSCIGAALQSLAGSPRIFQAMTQDDLLPYLKRFA